MFSCAHAGASSGRKEMKMSRFVKLILCIALIAAAFSLFAGCGPSEENAAPPAADRSGSGQGAVVTELISDEDIESVDISSLPEGYSCSLDGDNAEKIVSNISKMHLDSDFPENPDEYDGMTWVVKVRYKGNRESTLYLFGNMFIRTEEGPWYKMDYDEAAAIDKQLMNASAK